MQPEALFQQTVEAAVGRVVLCKFTNVHVFDGKSSDMCKNMRLCVAVAVYVLALVASDGIAMSQERSKLVDTGIIFSAEQLERSEVIRPGLLGMMGMTPPYWTPSPQDIAPVEAQLKSYLEDVSNSKREVAGDANWRVPSQAKAIGARLGSYKRQYVGYTDRGKRWILVNGFCEDHLKDEDTWRDRLVVVIDGGLCFFKALYDTSKSQYAYLLINDG